MSCRTQLNSVGISRLVDLANPRLQLTLLVLVLLLVRFEFLYLAIFCVQLQLHFHYEVFVFADHVLALGHLPVKLVDAREGHLYLAHARLQRTQLLPLSKSLLLCGRNQIVSHQRLLSALHRG